MTNNFLNEEWLPVVGWEGWYEVSSKGRLKRVASGRSTFSGRIIAGWTSRKGYIMHLLSAPGRSRTVSKHRLVADAFLGLKPSESSVIRHLNGEKTDNRAVNLMWGTTWENAQDEIRLGRSKTKHNVNRVKTQCPKGHEYTPANTYTDPLGRRYCRICAAFKKYAARKGGLRPGDRRHGSANGYNTYGCRCPDCRNAWTIYRKELRGKQ